MRGTSGICRYQETVLHLPGGSRASAAVCSRLIHVCLCCLVTRLKFESSKSATTSPGLCQAPAHNMTQTSPMPLQGPHWWDECIFPSKGACTTPPNGDFEGYIDLFRKAAGSIVTHTQAITGEASSNTFTSANGVYLR